MPHASNLSRPTRLVTIGAVLALHAAMLALVLAVRGLAEDAPVAAAPMKMIDIGIEAPPAVEVEASSPPVLPSRIVTETAPPAPPTIISEASDGAGAGGSCVTLTAVSDAINADSDAVARIQSAPEKLRSVSGAVVIWNAGWSDGVRLPEDPLQPVRRVIETTLQAVEPQCLNEQVTGPRLVAIPNGNFSMYAVLGSGTWSWAQMLLPDGVVPAPLPSQAPGAIPWPKDVPPAG